MIEVREGGLDEPQVEALLDYHYVNSHADTPEANAHALDVEALRRDAAIAFYSAWEHDKLLGVAALRELAPGHGEVKSMRTSPEHLRKGVSRGLLNHILLTARDRGYERLSLETGTAPSFAPANRLYENFGFVDAPAFGDYPPSDHNRFMTLAL
ncbi:MAG: GNAT family N-acetyltransferase [Pseudomonadota bacterium]